MALSMAAPAFAQPSVTGAVQNNGGQTFTSDGHQSAAISDYAFATASGNIGANVAAGNANQQSNAAFVGTNGEGSFVVSGAAQSNGGNWVYDDTKNDASIGGHAFESTSGNVGVNVAAGNGNQQSNAMYINTASTENIAVGLTLQGSGWNFVVHDGHQTAGIGTDAFNTVGGNIGANVASGNLNQQSNSAVILTDTNLADAGAGAAQSTGGSLYCRDGHNSATIGQNAFQAVTGNVGANVASGNANQQSNALVINNNDYTP